MSGTLSMRRYVQSHILRGDLTDRLTESRGAAEPFDGIVEVWFDVDDFGSDMTEEQLAANIQLLEDERTFIDRAGASGWAPSA